jgi:8-amino-7-oxononanoate synthase
VKINRKLSEIGRTEALPRCSPGFQGGATSGFRSASAPPRPNRAGELAEPLQQIDRTHVLHRGRKFSYFAGCDYFRLASHPDVLRAVREGLDQFGLNVAASRKTTGNHPLYQQLEDGLAKFFRVPGAVLVSNGYMTNLAVAQALAGEFTHALIDERAHGCLFDAAKLLGCPVLPFAHRNVASATGAAGHAGRRAKLLLLTDGLFSHSGEVAPLVDYLRLLPESTTLLVDDAHGAGVLGENGRGTAEHLGAPTHRIIQTITLSKAFGIYGGAVVGSGQIRSRIIERSRLFVGNTPLPLPLVTAALTSLQLVRKDAGFRQRLAAKTNYVKSALAHFGFEINRGPGPVIPLVPRSTRDAERVKKELLARRIYPPFINYLGGPTDAYFRFVISSEHTPEQLQQLVEALTSSRKRS